MGFLDKLKFWKKEPSLDLGPEPELGLEFGRGYESKDGQDQFASPSNDYFQQQRPTFSPPANPFQSQSFQPAYPQQNEIINKNIEVVSSKLDALKATLDALNQRMENLEQIARSEQNRRKGW